MREENLFQLATEELNSRDRKTELWARACALATDDVDEARYLYTNLRVEELAREHNIDLAASTPAPSERGEFTLLEDDKVDETVSLSVNYVDEPTPPDKSGESTELPVKDGLTPAQVALQRARSKFANDELGEAGDTEEDTDNSNSTEATAGDVIGEKPETKEPHSDLSLADLTADVSEVTDNTILIDAERGEASGDTAMNLLDPEDAGAPAQGLQADAVAATDPLETSALPTLTDTPDNDFFSENTLDPADDILPAASKNASDESALPGLDSTTESAPSDGNDNSKVATAALGAAVAASAAVAATSTASATPTSNATLDATTEDAAQYDSSTGQKIEEENELTGGEFDEASIAAASVEHDTVERFEIYRNKEGLVNAVELGNSWKALFLTLPWLFSRRLWGHSIMYVLMSMVLLAGLIAMVPRVLGTGAATTGATQIDMLVAAGFVLLAIVGWLYLPYKLANRWHATKVTAQGYEFQTSADARTRNEAEQRFLVRHRMTNPAVETVDVWKNVA